MSVMIKSAVFIVVLIILMTSPYSASAQSDKLALLSRSQMTEEQKQVYDKLTAEQEAWRADMKDLMSRLRNDEVSEEDAAKEYKELIRQSEATLKRFSCFAEFVSAKCLKV